MYSEKWNSIRNSIEDDSVRIVSFDLFRTLVDRPFENDQFLQLLCKVLSIDMKDLNRRRDTRSWWKCGEDVQKCAEMGLEKSLIRFRESVRELFFHAKECGKYTVLITDNYLPSTFLRSTLEGAGIHFDRIFVSCEYGDCTKLDGRLFYHVIAELKEVMPDMRPDQMLHIGDDPIRDVLNAEKAGLRSVYYPGSKACYRGSLFDKAGKPERSGDHILRNYMADSIYDDPFFNVIDDFLRDPDYIVYALFPFIMSLAVNTSKKNDIGVSDVLNGIDGLSGRAYELYLGSRKRVAEPDDIGYRVLQCFFGGSSDAAAYSGGAPGWCAVDSYVRSRVIDLCRDFVRNMDSSLEYLNFSMTYGMSFFRNVLNEYRDFPLTRRYTEDIGFFMPEKVRSFLDGTHI